MMNAQRVNDLSAFVAIVVIPFTFAMPVILSGRFYCFCLLAAGLTGFRLLGGNLRTLFRPLRLEDMWIVIFCALAAAVIGMTTALTGTYALHVPISEALIVHRPLIGVSMLQNLFTLFGEEMMAVLVLTVCESYLPQKKRSLLWATLLSCLIFGAYHIGACGWHVWNFTILSCLVKLPFAYAWYRGNRNLLVNGLAHWSYMMLILAFANHILIYA